MKRLLLSFAILMCLSLAVGVNAQNVKKKEGQRSPITKGLNLSADQQQKMESIHKDFGDKMKELRENSALTKEDKQSKMKDLRDLQIAEINKILTPEQQSKMKEVQGKRVGRDIRRSGMNDRANKEMKSRRENRLKELNLTEDQKEKIKAINEDFRTKSKELADKHREALGQVYTPEQQQKLKDLKFNESRDYRFGFNGKKRGNYNLDEASRDKLKALRENFEKEKKAIELSRIAPDAQKQKIKDLHENFIKEKRQIIGEAKKTMENKPS